ncbi:hypothetical protein C882_0056 [Caenispirillum salinarum AK4]|uniref:Uncharacterized protein n=1 Tax=Caenispirillum salinarum AK4 TaxID=1238182 RepID=K9GVG1_9PROT|nr:hypothetical protein C882_0056 [Caenispirillum salinarum AK4]
MLSRPPRHKGHQEGGVKRDRLAAVSCEGDAIPLALPRFVGAGGGSKRFRKVFGSGCIYGGDGIAGRFGCAAGWLAPYVDSRFRGNDEYFIPCKSRTPHTASRPAAAHAPGARGAVAPRITPSRRSREALAPFRLTASPLPPPHAPYVR